MVNSGDKSLGFIKGVRAVLNEIRSKEFDNIEKASGIISSALIDGHKVYYFCEGHITPLATGYGFSGDTNLFLPIEMSELLSFGPYRNRMEGDVLIVSAQFDSTKELNQIASQAKLLGARIVFIGTPSDRTVIPTSLPSESLAEMSDVCINAHTPMGDALLSYEGLTERVGPTSGITSIAIFYFLSLEVAEKLFCSQSSTPKRNA